MKIKNLHKAPLFALAILFFFTVAWEGYWRSKGFKPTYNDDKMLWAVKRAEVYQPVDKATVFIGSSRIKFDLDIPEWRKLTGEDVVQLSLVGTSPILLLEDLANDENFHGKLLVDVTEPLFFSQNPVFHKFSSAAISYYQKQTPTEKFSARIGFGLESKLVFLEERKFALNELLNSLNIPNRPGVFSFPAFPKAFELNTFDRQTYMPEMFLSDSQQVNRLTNIWTTLIMGDPTPPVSGDALEAIFDRVVLSVDKITKRGGQVVFTRTPSSGPMGEGEKMAFPRERYWEPLLERTGALGLHFRDHPVTAQFICPEWSHLSPADAVIYTRVLEEQLRDLGWFSKPTDTSNLSS